MILVTKFKLLDRMSYANDIGKIPRSCDYKMLKSRNTVGLLREFTYRVTRNEVIF